MDNQITLAQLYSPCKNCFYEYRGECISSRSEYSGSSIPLKACIYYDGCSGGIPLDELIRSEGR